MEVLVAHLMNGSGMFLVATVAATQRDLVGIGVQVVLVNVCVVGFYKRKLFNNFVNG